MALRLALQRARNWAIVIVLVLLPVYAALRASGVLDPAVTARPALWRISSGDRHAWLFGTIHAVPVGARWLSPAIEKAAKESDWLVLEVAGIEAERRDRHVFESLGRSPGLPPVAARLAPADRPLLTAMTAQYPADLRDLDRYESWAAALMIGANISGNLSLSTDDAGEARFSRLFAAERRPVIGLETVRGQLGLFDTLPESDQRALLSEALHDAANARTLYRTLYADWARGDLAALQKSFLMPLDRAPHRADVLLYRRNLRWALTIDHLLRHNDRTLFVAVGAGHLLGPRGVHARLAALGWRIERIE